MTFDWLQKLTRGLAKTSSRLGDGVASIFTGRRRLDDAVLEELEDVLIASDIGPAMAVKMTAQLAKTRFNTDITDEDVRKAFADHITSVLTPVAVPLIPEAGENGPHVILVVGVNGAGKTTTIGKLAKQFSDQGKSVLLVAGDTFRAAAIEQLKIWGERTQTPVVAREMGRDAASVVFDGLRKARDLGTDIVLIDTAGRLHNKSDLMQELQKVVRIIHKQDATAPHDTLMVLDATTGQNALQQVKVFQEMVNVSGLVITKLDGTAKGGVTVALADRFALPVHAVGVGEQAEDLRAFEARDFAHGMMGLPVSSTGPS